MPGPYFDHSGSLDLTSLGSRAVSMVLTTAIKQKKHAELLTQYVPLTMFVKEAKSGSLGVLNFHPCPAVP